MNQESLEILLANRSFVLWIKGEGSSEEEYWNTWLRENPEHQVLAEEAKELITALDNEYEIPDSRAELKKMEAAIGQYEDRRKQVPMHHYKPRYWKNRRVIAAGILLLIVCLGSFFAYQQYPGELAEKKLAEAAPVQEHNTKYGEKVTYRLSDGSKIILNANSTLRFSSTIEKGLNTEVWLEGEAYFNIAHLEGEQQRTFTVHTNDGSIQVLGTKFVVKTSDSETQTVLEEGKIRVHVRKEAVRPSNEYILEPGDLARFATGDNKIAVQKVNTQIYTSWTEDKMVFENTPMKEIAQRIEDTFGVDVTVKKELSEQNLTGSIKSTDLEVLTKALSDILKTKIEIHEQSLHIGIEDN